MKKAILAFALSAGLGIMGEVMYMPGVGIIISVSVIGAFFVYQNETRW